MKGKEVKGLGGALHTSLHSHIMVSQVCLTIQATRRWHPLQLKSSCVFIRISDWLHLVKQKTRIPFVCL